MDQTSARRAPVLRRGCGGLQCTGLPDPKDPRRVTDRHYLARRGAGRLCPACGAETLARQGGLCWTRSRQASGGVQGELLACMQLCSEPLTTASYYCRLKPLVCLICNQVGQYIVPSGDQDGTAVACLGWRVPTLRLGRAMENKFDVSEVLDEEGAIPLKTRMEAGEAWQLVDTTVVSPVDTVFHVGGFCTSGNCCNKVEKHICGRKTRTRRWVTYTHRAYFGAVLFLS